MLKQYELKMPKEVFSGENALSHIADLVKGSGKVGIYTDKGVRSAGLLDPIIREIEKAGKPYQVFDELATEPSYMQVQENIDSFKTASCDYLIAVGGGSVMDAAKLTSVLLTDQYSVKDLLKSPLLGTKHIKTLMIPTTAGTGAEATPNAIVAVPEDNVKIGIVNSQMMADSVILDPAMIRKLPRKIAASTGIDALCHAIECWTGNKANPFSDTFALQALDIILNNIEKACDDSNAVQEKGLMQIASFYAGVAITASGTTAVHALSYPLGGRYHIAHGIANAIMLMPVMRFNEEVCRKRMAEAYERCAHRNVSDMTEEEKSRSLLAWMNDIVTHLDIPASLSGFGVSRDDLEDLVKSGMEQQRLLVNNARTVTAEDAEQIYSQVLQATEA